MTCFVPYQLVITLEEIIRSGNEISLFHALMLRSHSRDCCMLLIKFDMNPCEFGLITRKITVTM